MIRCRKTGGKKNEESDLSYKSRNDSDLQRRRSINPGNRTSGWSLCSNSGEDGYKAVQVGFVDKREKLINKPMKGHFDKAGVSYKRYVREFRFENAEEYAVAQEIKADIFTAGDKIDATAISKGKGFQGAIKKNGQHRGPMAHGSKFHRHQGSNGACSDPSKVFKGKGMPGHMGHKQITVQNLEIVKVDVENNLLLVKGAVPGPKKALVTVKETVKSGK